VVVYRLRKQVIDKEGDRGGPDFLFLGEGPRDAVRTVDRVAINEHNDKPEFSP